MDVIVDQEICFHPEDSKTNLKIPFTLNHDYQRLVIHCAYAPKNVEDMVLAESEVKKGIEKYIPKEYRAGYGDWKSYLPVLNFVTFSLDHEGEFLGCAHRHAPIQDHTISADSSTPGFLAHAVKAGQWIAVLNVHAVVSPSVKYHLQITAA